MTTTTPAERPQVVPSLAESPAQQYVRYRRLFAGRSAPFAFVDLDAMWHNAAGMLSRAEALPIRVATKSVRCRDVLRRILDHHPRFSGLMTYTLAESVWLHEQGFGNILLAYPTVDRDALRRWGALEGDDTPAVMVDCIEHLDLIDECVPSPARRLRVCMDIDLGYRRAAGRLRFGPLRSPLRDAEDARALAGEIMRRRSMVLVGMMGYEGHVAGVGDKPTGKPMRGVAIGAMQNRWMEDVRVRREALVSAVSAMTPLDFVNGGGTGSLHLTAEEECVTEVAAGSGFYAPALFDNYSAFSLRPAAMFATPVVRRPGPEVVTVLGGGYVASGVAGTDRLPIPYLPRSMSLDTMEGAGEVQTPLHGFAAKHLRIGDMVYMRHAKAGELCEHFNSLLLVSGGEIVDEVPTYRGEGNAFL